MGRYPDIFACSASFHPSTEGVCKATQENDIDICSKIKVPQFLVSTSMESESWKPGGAAEKAIKDAGTQVTWLMEPVQKHGFMMRGDTSNAETLAAVKKYIDAMLEFYATNMKE